MRSWYEKYIETSSRYSLAKIRDPAEERHFNELAGNTDRLIFAQFSTTDKSAKSEQTHMGNSLCEFRGPWISGTCFIPVEKFGRKIYNQHVQAKGNNRVTLPWSTDSQVFNCIQQTGSKSFKAMK